MEIGEKSSHNKYILAAQSANRLEVSFLFVKDKVMGGGGGGVAKASIQEMMIQS